MSTVEPIDPQSVTYQGRDFTEAEARAITLSIKAYAKQTCFKLADAHDGRAYLALGYSSFEDYCATELDISRSRGYQLLRHATALRELADAAGIDPVSTNVHTPEGRTRAIDTTAAAADIAAAVEAEPDADDQRRAEIVDEVIEEHKVVTKRTTSIDPETGEILNEGPSSNAPASPPGPVEQDDDAAHDAEGVVGSPAGGAGAAPEGVEAGGSGLDPSENDEPAPSFATVGDLIDWCPDHGKWRTYDEMTRTDSARQFGRLMDTRLPRDEDDDLAGCCPPEARRAAIFAAEVAATYWTDLAADLRRLDQADRPALSVVEG